jgi:hypothetical protein
MMAVLAQALKPLTQEVPQTVSPQNSQPQTTNSTDNNTLPIDTVALSGADGDLQTGAPGAAPFQFATIAPVTPQLSANGNGGTNIATPAIHAGPAGTATLNQGPIAADVGNGPVTGAQVAANAIGDAPVTAPTALAGGGAPVADGPAPAPANTGAVANANVANASAAANPATNPQQAQLAELDQLLQQLGINPSTLTTGEQLQLLNYMNNPAAIEQYVQQLGTIVAQAPAGNEVNAAAQAQAAGEATNTAAGAVALESNAAIHAGAENNAQAAFQQLQTTFAAIGVENPNLQAAKAAVVSGQGGGALNVLA